MSDASDSSPLTTWAVAGALLLSMACLLVGLVLAARAAEVSRQVLPLHELPAGLAAGQHGAWLSLGLVLLLLTPVVRLVGMLRDFLRGGERRAALSAAGVTLLLIVSLVLGLQGRKLGASAGTAAPVDSRSR